MTRFMKEFGPLIEEIKTGQFKEVALGMSSSECTDGDVKVLVEALKCNKFIKKVFLGENQIGDEGAIALASIIRPEVSSIEELDLSGNNISQRGAEALSESSVKVLNLKYTAIGDSGLACFGKTTTLVALDASECCIGEKGTAVLQNTSLKSLSLNDNEITGMALGILPSNLQLEALYLSGNPISVKGIECLSQINSLRTLDLSRTDLGNAGIKAIVERMHFLEYLGLNNSNVDSQCAIELAKHPKLKRLGLCQNQVEFLGAFALLVARGTSLEEVDLSYNKVGGGVKVLTIEREKSMTVKLAGNPAYKTLQLSFVRPTMNQIDSLEFPSYLPLQQLDQKQKQFGKDISEGVQAGFDVNLRPIIKSS